MGKMSIPYETSTVPQSNGPPKVSRSSYVHPVNATITATVPAQFRPFIQTNIIRHPTPESSAFKTNPIRPFATDTLIGSRFKANLSL